MPLFTSQFDRARQYRDAYTGPSTDPTWHTPAAVVAVAGIVGVGALAIAADDSEPWGDGWDAGWDTAVPTGSESPVDDGSAWMDRGEYTDAGVGGDGDFFYYIDGDTSLTID